MPQRHQTRQEAVNKAYVFLLRQKLAPAEKEGFVRLDTNPIPALARELRSSESWARQLVSDLRANGQYEFVQGKNGDSNHWLLKLPEGEAGSRQLEFLSDSQEPRSSENGQAKPDWLNEFRNLVNQTITALNLARDKVEEVFAGAQEDKARAARLEEELDTLREERDAARAQADHACADLALFKEQLSQLLG